jgi:hypothetical protein
MSDIKLLRLDGKCVTELEGSAAGPEKSLQTLIEKNLEVFLGVRFLASEYVTGKTHGGRIDTLGIDENGCPVIIEYKRSLNQNVINQGLFYLDPSVGEESGLKHYHVVRQSVANQFHADDRRAGNGQNRVEVRPESRRNGRAALRRGDRVDMAAVPRPRWRTALTPCPSPAYGRGERCTAPTDAPPCPARGAIRCCSWTSAKLSRHRLTSG